LQDQGQYNESELNYRHAFQINPDFSAAHSSLLLGINYNSRYDIQTIFFEHLLFSEKFEKPLSSTISSHTNDRSLARRLKIGYVSPDFRKHSVAYFIEPIIASHSRVHFEVFCYSNSLVIDEVTKRIQNYSDQWRSIVGMSDENVAKLIRDDKIDILIDLSGHTADNRMLLFARKPAPVQVSWIGYPATTGLSNMDYRIVDSYTDPPGITEQFYTEKLLRLPDSFLCYRPPDESPQIVKLPVMVSGHVTFGSFNKYAKVSPVLLDLWIKILKMIPRSHLLLKAKSLGDTAVKKNFVARFTKEGIDRKRIELLALTSSLREHLNLYNRVDIGLDTFPYNGTTTTCEALWMGVPVITLAGKTYASRVGSSLLANVGLINLIAKTPDEYIEIAIQLAMDTKRLQLLRESLRTVMIQSPLTDAKRFTAYLEKIYHKMWVDWCKAD
jgi:protein O-GlcNAc transferase